MKRNLLKSLLALALVLVCGNVWGETKTIEINTENSGVTGSYAEKTFLVSDITFGFNQWMKNNNIQAKKSTTNSLYNVDAIPGTIKSITFVQTNTARAIMVYGGTAAKPTTEITAPTTAATMTFDFSGKEYNYFSMTTPGNACYFDKITITYEESSDPFISAQDVTIEADATEGAIAYTVTNPVEGKVLTASEEVDWISDVTVSNSDSKVTFKTTANTTNAERQGTITLSYEGATNKVVTVTQKKAVPTYSSIEELVNAGEPTGEEVKVTFNNTITGFQTSSGNRIGIYLDVNDSSEETKPVEIYCKNVPTEWLVGGTVSGTTTCPWKTYNGTWELCPTSWDGISYTAPVFEKHAVTIVDPENGSLVVKQNGTEVKTGDKFEEGTKFDIVATPAEGYKLRNWQAVDGSTHTYTSSFTYTLGQSDVTFKANFDAKEMFTITLFDKSEKTVIADVLEGSVISEVVRSYNPTETVDDFTFCGWSYEHNENAENLMKAEDVLKSNIDLYATYSKTEGTEATWELISSMDGFKAGYEVAIVGAYTDKEENTTYYYAMGEQKSNNRAGVKISLDGNAAIMADGVESFVVEEGTKEGTFALKSSDGYLYAASSSANNLKSQKTNNDNGSWAIAITSGTASVVAQGEITRNVMQFNYNGGTPIFSCYNSASQQPVSFYKKNGGFTTTYSFCEPAGYMVTISSVGYATFSSNSKSADEAVIIPEGVKAYTATYANKVVTLNEIEGGIIPAHEGVVLEGEPGTYFFEKTMYMGAAVADNDLWATGKYELSYEEMIDEGAEEYVYTLNNGSKGVNFYRMNEESKLGANKAYLRIAKAEFADEESSVSMRFGGDATLIESIHIVESNTYFDLQGRKVENPTNGLYIINGQKVLVK